MRVIVAITGASGSIYARLTIEALLRAPEVEQIALLYSDTAREVVAFEGVDIPSDERIKLYDNHDLFAPVASGSAAYDAMIVVPSSVGTLGRIAHGLSQTLIERAADVMLKERRRLILVVREAPYSLIHLRNMTALTEAGGIVVPASPSFYSHPLTIEEACMTVVERVIALLDIDQPHYEWQGK
ncbi:MAG: UbiX family flavin prenyltransferase [Alistipes sp.]|nr:UbiX family flavin prenyltransferase [Alistipes sp.]